MSFQSPHMLWALTGILIPVFIHLWSRKEHKVIKVGSIKMYSDNRTARASRLFPSHLILMLLRCLLVALLALWLAAPFYTETKRPSPLAYVIDPSLQGNDYVEKEIRNGEYPVHWLSEGLPVASPDDSPAISKKYNAWQYLHQLSGINSDSIVLLSTPLLRHLGHFRPAIPQNVAWILIENEGDSYPVEIEGFNYSYGNNPVNVQILGDRKTIRILQTPGNQKDTLAKPTVEAAVRFSEGQRENAVLLINLLEGLAGFTGTTLFVDSSDTKPESTTDCLFLFDERPFTPASFPVFLLSEELATPRITPGPSGTFLFPDLKNISDLNATEIPEQLMELTGMIRNPSWRSEDPRIAAASQVIPSGMTLGNALNSTEPMLFFPLLIIFALLFLVERFYSHRLGQ